MNKGIEEGLNELSSDGALWLLSRMRQHGLFETTIAQLSSDANIPREIASKLLEFLATKQLLEKGERFRCPKCKEPVERGLGICEQCSAEFLPHEELQEILFFQKKPPGRDVPWMLLIHGMNTRGSWQERFSWRAALLHGRSIPVFGYKYGKIRPGVLIRWRRRKLVKRTGEILNELGGNADSVHLGTRPDVIAHSFGTWLIVHALISNKDLKIGRLVLVGSIVPPDFDWAKIAGQYEGVLNHRSGRDKIVRLARFFISESGPSGVRGFLDPLICDHRSPDWGHSDSFKGDNLKKSFEEVWGPFLTKPVQ